MTGIILAGGRSTRLQRNKALVEMGGATLVERQIRRLEGICREVILVVNDPEPYRHLGVRVVLDRYRGKGPLAGIHAGLEASGDAYNFVLACDMPFFSPELALYMKALAPGYQVVVPCPDGLYEPLNAIYAIDCLPAIETTLAQEGVTRIVAFYPRVKVYRVADEELAPFGSPQHLFFNINTPQDLQRALALQALER